jgi:hypothetical protein
MLLPELTRHLPLAKEVVLHLAFLFWPADFVPTCK